MSADHLFTAVLVARLLRRLFLCLLVLPGVLNAAPNLQFEVNGLEGELRRNVLAFLGQAPETPQERLNFVVPARGRVENGLIALGYYRPDIDIETLRTELKNTGSLTPVVLKKQTENIARFGGERFVSTEVDVLGPHILRLLRAAERGKASPATDAPEARDAAPTSERRFQMEV